MSKLFTVILDVAIFTKQTQLIVDIVLVMDELLCVVLLIQAVMEMMIVLVLQVYLDVEPVQFTQFYSLLFFSFSFEYST